MASVIVAALLILVVALTASTVYLFLRLRSLEMDVEGIVQVLQQYEDESQLLAHSGKQLLYS